MDGLDDLDELSQKPPSRPSKFAPKSAKFKPQQPKLKPKTEPQIATVPEKAVNNEQEEDIKPKIDPSPKKEPSVSSDSAVKMEIDSDPVIEDEHEEIENAEEEEEDMIVREIDVFFTPSIDPNTQLYVMQYPLRPCWRPYELDERCQEVRVKPQSKEVELDLSIDDSANWDPAQAAKFNIKKQTLSTSFMPPRLTGYAVGVLIGNKLHLNPIHAVVQLRPSMEHVSSSDSKRKGNITLDTEAKFEDGKPIDSSKKQIKRMESTSNQISNADECWISLKYHGSKSDFSSGYLQKMRAQESSSMEFTMSPYDYMSSLCPVASNEKTKSKGFSRRFLLSLPLEERVKKLLLEGPPVQRFSVLKHFAPNDTVEDLLEALQEHGLLVQGLWAPKTSLLISDSNSKQASRDFVLCFFSKNLFIKSSQLNLLPKSVKEDSVNFVKLFAVERPSFKDWKFKEQPDTTFIKTYPDIVRKHEAAWENAEKHLSMLFDRLAKATTRNHIPKSHMVQKPEKQCVPESIPKGPSGSRLLTKTTITAESREAFLKVLPKVFQIHKVCRTWLFLSLLFLRQILEFL
ncbi:uncharacterized protein LOC126656757 isoform X2 [Mercurialis annua]|uniref:uncharacterized protein LOC126656757 isoform X2 n=1 Tax=Mercurialis annua TaxID=3986 RepID=UPI00215E3080|nr:uncharacterized protein LOC126656757 isoform X2 [Mercurialis annua]